MYVIVVDAMLLHYFKHSKTEYIKFLEIKDTREEHDALIVLIDRDVLPSGEDSTWKAIQTLHEFVPELLDTFMDSPRKRTFKKSYMASFI